MASIKATALREKAIEPDLVLVLNFTAWLQKPSLLFSEPDRISAIGFPDDYLVCGDTFNHTNPIFRFWASVSNFRASMTTRSSGQPFPRSCLSLLIDSPGIRNLQSHVGAPIYTHLCLRMSSTACISFLRNSPLQNMIGGVFLMGLVPFFLKNISKSVSIGFKKLLKTHSLWSIYRKITVITRITSVKPNAESVSFKCACFI